MSALQPVQTGGTAGRLNVAALEAAATCWPPSHPACCCNSLQLPLLMSERSYATHQRQAAGIIRRRAALRQALGCPGRHRLGWLLAAALLAAAAIAVAHVDLVPADAGVLQALQGAEPCCRAAGFGQPAAAAPVSFFERQQAPPGAARQTAALSDACAGAGGLQGRRGRPAFRACERDAAGACRTALRRGCDMAGCGSVKGAAGRAAGATPQPFDLPARAGEAPRVAAPC